MRIQNPRQFAGIVGLVTLASLTSIYVGVQRIHRVHPSRIFVVVSHIRVAVHRLHLRIRLHRRVVAVRRGEEPRDGAAEAARRLARDVLGDGRLLHQVVAVGGLHVALQWVLAQLRPRGAARHHRLLGDGAAQEELWLSSGRRR